LLSGSSEEELGRIIPKQTNFSNISEGPAKLENFPSGLIKTITEINDKDETIMAIKISENNRD
jgi:hypothetical protein